MRNLCLLTFTFIIGYLFSCREHPPGTIILPVVPDALNDGISVSSLEDQNMDAEIIGWLANIIREGRYGDIHSLLICRNGHLVFEEYFNGYNRGQLHTLQAVTHTVISALIGIAIADGHIENVNQKLEEFLPEFQDIFDTNTARKNTEIQHALSMRTGIEWNELYLSPDSPQNTNFQMKNSDDWLRFVLERPAVRYPGVRFDYGSGNAILLAGVIKNATGLQADQYAEQVLFEPLDITEYEWDRQADGLPHANDGLKLSSRDMAKIGQIYLNAGRWNGVDILTPAWIEQSVTIWASVTEEIHYGYHWWLLDWPQSPDYNQNISGIIYSYGYGGQYIILIPHLNLAVVFTGWNENMPSGLYFEILTDFIVEAINDIPET